MEQVLRMLTSGETGEVTERMSQVPAESSRHAEAHFYGNFYLGLYADASGDAKEARERLDRAAKNAPHHYMGDVARVYARHLAE